VSDPTHGQPPTTIDPADQIPAEILAEASAAAQAIFDRALHLYAPPPVFVDQAIAAAGAVFVNALAANIHRRAQVAEAALNIRDQRNALQARLDFAVDRIKRLRGALHDVITADLHDRHPSTEDALRVVNERAEAALNADQP
jgi:hypothetical protein